MSSHFSKFFLNISATGFCSGSSKSGCSHTWHCASTYRSMRMCTAWYLLTNSLFVANFEDATSSSDATWSLAVFSISTQVYMNVSQRSTPWVRKRTSTHHSVAVASTQVYMNVISPPHPSRQLIRLHDQRGYPRYQVSKNRHTLTGRRINRLPQTRKNIPDESHQILANF